jgi:hypothetical protein
MTKCNDVERKIVYGTIWEPSDWQPMLCFMGEGEARYFKYLMQVLNTSKTWGEFLARLPEDEYENFLEYYQSKNYSPGKPFDPGDIDAYCAGDWPERPIFSMLGWMPQEIVDKYGEVIETLLDGEYLIIRPENERHVVKALREVGYIVKKNDKLVKAAQLDDYLRC